MAVPLAQFVKHLEDSGILAGETLQDFIPPKAAPKDAEELLRELLRQKKLTRFQAEELWRGKGKSLVLGNYLLLEKIGQGGMGAVYKAEHRRMHRIVAIKMLPPAMTKDALAIARFEREVTAAAKLRHPHIVAADDADEANGVHFLVMEYIEGGDLAWMVKRNGPFPVEQAVNFILQAARGLEYAHSQGVIHRDIKPANLLLASPPVGKGGAGGVASQAVDSSSAQRQPIVKILDMGLARIEQLAGPAQAELTYTGAIMGTVDYMPPEQAMDTKTADARADIYSLGCSLFYLLTGKAMYHGDTLMKKLVAHREQPIPSLRAIRAEVPEQVEAIFCKMVAKQIDERYQTMTEVIADLEQCRKANEQPAETQQPFSALTDAGLTDFLKEISVGRSRPARPQKSPARLLGKNPKQLLLIGGGVLAVLALLAVLLISQRTKDGKQSVTAKPVAAKDEQNVLADAAPVNATAARDRKAANWVLSVGGFVQVKTIDGKISTVHKPSDFPAGDWQLRAIFFANDLRLKDTDLANISHLEHLEVLQLSRCSQLTDACSVHLKDLRVLAELRINGTAMTDKAFENLAHLRFLSGVTMNAEQFTDRMVSALKQFPRLSGMGIDGAADIQIELLVREFPGLDQVHVHNGQATSRGYAVLATLTRAVALNASFSTITDADLQALTELPLQNLVLVRTQITDAAVPVLSRFTRLKFLSISETKITAVGVAKLREALPECEIDSDYTNYRYPTKPSTASAAAAKKPLAFETPGFDQWVNEVAGMPAEEQVKAIARKLQQLNPGFDGNATPVITYGVVKQLTFLTDNVTDISPVRAMSELTHLGCDGSNDSGMGKGKGSMSDLSPLQGMTLTWLNVWFNPVADLSPLKGMPLEVLRCSGTEVCDLSPLTGMPLTYVDCRLTKVADLSPLKDMTLTELHCGTTEVSDLAPLKGMPLTTLVFHQTKVSDLSALNGMQLSVLHCYSTNVTDLSPLKDMPLKKLECDFKPFRDTELLRSIKTLETINDKPAAEFWKEVEAEQAGFEAWTKQVATLPAEKQVEAVARKLQELNPGFDGKMTPGIQNGVVVTALTFLTDNVTDISPVRALQGLTTLICGCSEPSKGNFSDLSPLMGMRLTNLGIHYTQVSDLSPLTGMKLSTLNCANTKVAELSPLKGMPLVELSLVGSKVSDLSPLNGMPLTSLATQLTQVSDLAPLRGMKLTELWCGLTKVTDLSPLKDMPLMVLQFSSTNVTDLSPLKDMPLKTLWCDFKPARDKELLRSIKTLEKINDKPAAEFWKEVEAREAEKKPNDKQNAE